MAKRRATPKKDMVSVAAVEAMLSKLTIPLAGFHIEGRHEYAAFNLGRYQQAAIMALAKLPRGR